jgi:hypothetical protein
MIMCCVCLYLLISFQPARQKKSTPTITVEGDTIDEGDVQSMQVVAVRGSTTPVPAKKRKSGEEEPSPSSIAYRKNSVE